MGATMAVRGGGGACWARAAAATAAEAAEAAAECAYMPRGGNAYFLDYQIMCNLFAKVWRIMRNCAVPWTAAHLRYVRLYCAFRHMQGRPCATPRHVNFRKSDPVLQCEFISSHFNQSLYSFKLRRFTTVLVCRQCCARCASLLRHFLLSKPRCQPRLFNDLHRHFDSVSNRIPYVLFDFLRTGKPARLICGGRQSF